MADRFAKSLLAEIESEGLDTFLLSQHANATHQEPRHLGISALDTLLQPYLQARVEQAHPQPQARAKRQACAPLIEVAGAGPCSGKTQLLYRIAASLLLGNSTETKPHEEPYADTDDAEAGLSDASPASSVGENTHTVARPGGLVIWMDCAGTFDIQRLDRVLSSMAPTSDLSSRLATLTHFHLYRPASFSALLDTLSALPSDLLGRSARTGAAPSAHRHVAALIVSAASSFLPFERAAAHSDPSQPPHKLLDARYARLVSLLRTVQQRLGCPVVATRRAGAAGPGLPVSWVKAVDVRLRVSRGDWRDKVPRGISVLEALEWREGRRNARARVEEEIQKEKEEQETRVYLEGRGHDEVEVEREADEQGERRNEDARAQVSADTPARFDGSVAGKGREASGFAMCVDSTGVWIEAL